MSQPLVGRIAIAICSPLSSVTGGLSSQEAAAHLLTFGPNEPAATHQDSGLRDYLRALASPLVFILLCASAISMFVGEVVDACLIVGIVLIGVTISFVQSHKSQRAAERLREQVSPTATVLRDGLWTELLRREVVPGDIIQLSAGDLVPADASLLVTRDLHVQEAVLTGESLPSEKACGDGPTGRVFLGTSIVNGSATAEVTAAGTRTEFGDRRTASGKAAGDRVRARSASV
jgi:P-type Mg2+ transporter